MGTPLVTLFNVPPSRFSTLNDKLDSIIDHGKWQIPKPLIDFPTVAENALKIILSVTPLADRRICQNAADGVLSAKLAYHTLLPPHVTLDWAKDIWRNCIPPSHSFVFWHLMLLKLPTDENLQKCGCTLVSICVLCGKHAETSAHLFLNCEFAVAIWRWLGSKLSCTFILTSSVTLLTSIPQRCSSQLHDVCLAAIVHTVHTIWVARNSIRFSSAQVTLHVTTTKIAAMVSLFDSSSTGKFLLCDVDLLDAFLVPPLYRRVADIIPVVWKPPTITWVKANTDDSVVNSNAACGGIFRDFRGTFLGGFASNLGDCSVFEAELTGLVIAMEFAALYNWPRVWLESDSASAVQAFKNPSSIPLRLRNRWHNCMQHGLFTICSHIFREGNGCADTMASLGYNLTVTSCIILCRPHLRLIFLETDMGFPIIDFLSHF